jgi:uncharacterized protein
VSAVFAIQLAYLYAEIANRDLIVESQRTEIDRYLDITTAQRDDLQDKTLQLNDLNAELVSKSLEIDSLGYKMTQLQKQAQLLQSDLALLQSKINSQEQHTLLTHDNAKRVRISHNSLAVINGGKGIVFPIEVEIIDSGTGAISVDVSNTQFEATFQNAVRTAATVASTYTGKSIYDKDIIVRITDSRLKNEQSTIDGNSAGALISGMIVAGLTDKGLNKEILVTGSINPNGTVGMIANLEEKTLAATEVGSKVLLVPLAQEFDSDMLNVVGVLNIDEVVKYLVTST